MTTLGARTPEEARLRLAKLAAFVGRELKAFWIGWVIIVMFLGSLAAVVPFCLFQAVKWACRYGYQQIRKAGFLQ